MHGDGLNVANRVPCSEYHDEAADTQFADLGDKFLVRDLRVLHVVAVRDEAPESHEARGVENAVLEPRQEEADTVLADTEDALDVLAVFSLVAHEDIAAHADDFQQVALTVGVEEAREGLSDKMHFLHLLGRLSDELLCWEDSLL